MWVAAPGEYEIAGAVQGQHFCNLEWVVQNCLFLTLFSFYSVTDLRIRQESHLSSDSGL